MSSTNGKIFDLAIIGAGPIGIELHALAKQAGLSVVHIEAQQIGHTISWYAPGTHFFSSPERIQIAGVPLVTLNQDKATREEYLQYLRQVTAMFELPIHTFEPVTQIVRPDESTNGHFTIHTAPISGDRSFHAKHVALCTGDMHAPRLLGVPGEDLPHVDHYLRDPHNYFDRRVLIVGGKNSAVEAAIRLYRTGAHVTLSHRQPEISGRVKYWLRPELLSLFKSERIRYLPNTTPKRFTAQGAELASVTTNETIFAQADNILALTGYVQDTSLFQQVGINLVGETRSPDHNRGTMQTNIDRLFVAGTATAGTQHHGVTVFIETSHVHCRKIVRAITGDASPAELQAPSYLLPES
ncbi:MAG: NAD(P)-binding domain-containing protein [Planctomycetota bacterium]